MTPTFAIKIEPDRKLMRVTLGGLFGLADVAALELAKRAALVKLGAGPNQHLTLVDVSACNLQPQEVVQAFEAAIGDTRFMARRLAFVTGSSLVRMQARRLAARRDADIFETVDAAEAWLFEAPAEQARHATG